MTIVLPHDEAAEARKARRVAQASRIARLVETLGFGFLAPLVKAAAGDQPGANLKEAARLIGVPLFAIALFLVDKQSLLHGSLARGRPRPLLNTHRAFRVRDNRA
ncbi:hypothetical protein CNY89_08135, partial [Amaricoccus sp. HAR-UPW-R2A-40]